LCCLVILRVDLDEVIVDKAEMLEIQNLCRSLAAGAVKNDVFTVWQEWLQRKFLSIIATDFAR